jgi:hypothetical protein
MSADNVAALVAAAVSGVAALSAFAVVVLLARRLRELREIVDDLRGETVPLVRDARVVVDQAATEMLRVGDVLSSAEAVTGTVDSASRLAYRTFANPVVKVLAFGTGVGGAFRRLFSRGTHEVRRPAVSPPAVETSRGPSDTRARTVHRRRLHARAPR